MPELDNKSLRALLLSEAKWNATIALAFEVNNLKMLAQTVIEHKDHLRKLANSLPQET